MARKFTFITTSVRITHEDPTLEEFKDMDELRTNYWIVRSWKTWVGLRNRSLRGSYTRAIRLENRSR
jgi:hypothetical protein